MSAPVDVLAVMRAVAEFGVSAPEWHDMPKAVAAVAELIEAAKSVDALYPKHWDLASGGAVIFPENVPSFEEAFKRLGAALASIGGAE